MLLGEPIVLGGGPKSLGELLIVRTSRFLAEPGKLNKKQDQMAEQICILHHFWIYFETESFYGAVCGFFFLYILYPHKLKQWVD